MELFHVRHPESLCAREPPCLGSCSESSTGAELTWCMQDERTGDLLRLGRKSGYAVPREKIHKVLSWAHEVTEHAGRDKLYRFLGEYYSVDW